MTLDEILGLQQAQPTAESILAEPVPQYQQPPDRPIDKRQILSLVLGGLGDYLVHHRARRAGLDRTVPGEDFYNRFLALRERRHAEDIAAANRQNVTDVGNFRMKQAYRLGEVTRRGEATTRAAERLSDKEERQAEAEAQRTFLREQARQEDKLRRDLQYEHERSMMEQLGKRMDNKGLEDEQKKLGLGYKLVTRLKDEGLVRKDSEGNVVETIIPKISTAIAEADKAHVDRDSVKDHYLEMIDDQLAQLLMSKETADTLHSYFEHQWDREAMRVPVEPSLNDTRKKGQAVKPVESSLEGLPPTAPAYQFGPMDNLVRQGGEAANSLLLPGILGLLR